ncbi:MAG: hypothetical protein IKO05_00630 [Selenomonadaceae bacterium]|nr:hypothetical protein [Selenomonadaceae bacterium]
MLKKFFVGALTAFVLMSFDALTEATQVEQENICCRGYCSQDCDEPSGEYCGRYGCGQNGYRGGR